MYNPKEQRPNAIQALQEVEKRLRLNIKGDIAIGRWEAIQIILAVKDEILSGITARMLAEMPEPETTDIPEAESDALDFVGFLKQCRP